MPDIATRIDGVFETALAEKRIIGAVSIVMCDGAHGHRKAYGLADREAGSAMKPDALFRYSSLTKPIVTAAAMRLIELGELALDASVTDWLPGFRPTLADGSAPAISIRQLMTHTSGLAYDFMQPVGGPYQQNQVSAGADQPGLSMDEEMRRLSAAGLTFPPGAAWFYSNAIDVLGAVMEKTSGETLQAILARLVTGPLKMTDTAFHVVDADRLATPYSNAAPEPIRIPERYQQPFLPNLAPISFDLRRAFDATSFPSGGAGMNGSADDMARFLEAIRTGGGGIVSRESASAMMTNQIGDKRILFDPTGSTGFGFGGAVMLDPAKAGSPLSPGAWYWGGVWGHHWYVDPARKLTIVTLTNTTLEGMSGQLARDVVPAVVGA
jgi:CubicO group peptidase (beta-lactamase class C family)